MRAAATLTRSVAGFPATSRHNCPEVPLPQPLYSLGDTGPAVVQIRQCLVRLGLLASSVTAEAPYDASYDTTVERAVRAFQQQRGLIADGLVGSQTWRCLDDARWRLGDRVLRYGVRHMQTGDDVQALQRRLHDFGFNPGRIDGIFGPETERALREFQQNVGIPTDGLCGPVTFKSLDRLARTVVGGNSHLIREAERMNRSGPGLTGKVIVVDPGHGGPDTGVSANGLTEADLAADLAARVEGRLGAAGATAFLTRGPNPQTTLSDRERAAFANEVDADLLLSLHIDGATSPQAQGVAAFYYGTRGPSGVHSAVGEAFAELVQQEIVERTQLLDARTHPKTWEILQLSRMPAVRLDIGYLTNADDARRLGDSGFRDLLAETVLICLQRVYQPADLRPQERVPASAG